jgi:hypothetical protein
MIDLSMCRVHSLEGETVSLKVMTWATQRKKKNVAHGLTFEGVLCPLKELIGGSHKEKRSYAADKKVKNLGMVHTFKE